MKHTNVHAEFILEDFSRTQRARVSVKHWSAHTPAEAKCASSF